MLIYNADSTPILAGGPNALALPIRMVPPFDITLHCWLPKLGSGGIIHRCETWITRDSNGEPVPSDEWCRSDIALERTDDNKLHLTARSRHGDTPDTNAFLQLNPATLNTYIDIRLIAVIDVQGQIAFTLSAQGNSVEATHAGSTSELCDDLNDGQTPTLIGGSWIPSPWPSYYPPMYPDSLLVGVNTYSGLRVETIEIEE